MKFGKQILNQQIKEWSLHYINYKALKKIINSLKTSTNTNERSIPPTMLTISARFPSKNGVDPVPIDEYQKFLQQQKAAFFFKLERELEKVNSFYLQKEAEFKVRLRSLNDKKKILLCCERKLSAGSASIVTLREGFQRFQQDLNKLQQFIEINATGFRKILKKWDKRSKSSTKELYLSRQVEVQPCFNRDIIAELTDNASSNLLALDDIALSNSSSSSPRSPERRSSIGDLEEPDVMDDIETELLKAITIGPISAVQEILERIQKHPSGENRDHISRVFWRACSEGSEEAIQLLVDTKLINFKYMDDISDRTYLHEATIVGRLSLIKLCIEHNVQVDCTDVYGRQPSHYICMYGHNEAATYLLSVGANVDSRDHDGYTPLIYAITNGHTKCVKILLDHGANIEPQKEGDHIPLSLACQYGHKDTALLLLDKGAKIMADAEGLSPLHLTSRQGHHNLSKILTEHGALLDTLDKYNGWSPIFFAASEGHIECVKVLLDAGCQVNITDEFGHTPIYYAASEGHIECYNLLNSASGRSEISDSIRDEEPPPISQNIQQDHEMFDYNIIPSLSLPPPMIPVRIYGHNYLDKKYHVQVTLGHNSGQLSRPPVHLYGNSQISSLKLIISSKPDLGMIPHSIILPLGDEREIFSFQLDSLDNFSLEFDIFPTFGSRVIGKGVALPHVFDINNGHERRNNLVIGGTGGKCICPLFDTHLKVVGEVSFEFAIVKPFQSAQLEFGGRVETYWRSSLESQAAGFITGSSLSGEYIQIVVQVTRDMIAVVYPEWMVSAENFDLSVSDITFQQFKALGKKDSVDFKKTQSTTELQKMIHEAHLSLEEVLKMLPSSYGVNLEIKYPTVYEMTNYWFYIPNINSYVDTILLSVYDHAQERNQEGTTDKQENAADKEDGATENYEGSSAHKRSVIFSSFNPAICTAVNWKQPNYAVFFKSYCGFENDNVHRGKKRKERVDHDDGGDVTYKEVNVRDKRSTSIKEAVKFAKSNNLLGVICEATLLVQVPSLITNVKEAGLILITFGSANNDARNVRIQERYGVDALMVDGVIKYNSRLDAY